MVRLGFLSGARTWAYPKFVATWFVVIAAVGWVDCVCFQRTANAGPQVDLVVLLGEGAPLTAGQDWIKELKELGFSNIRIRSPRSGDRVEVQSSGSKNSQRYAVKGILTRRNQLRLPGGNFSLGDRGRIAQWLEKLRRGGEEELHARPAAFGLTEKSLLEVHNGLRRVLSEKTRGKSSARVLARISDRLDLKVVLDGTARRILGEDLPIGDELVGMSCGTAMAALLRPLGLILVPRAGRSREVALQVTVARNASESWPVGWPVERRIRDVIPQFFEFLKVEIDDQPLDQVIEVLAGRLEVPMLYDHQSLARAGVDPAERLVSVTRGRSYYKRILDKILVPSKLKSEVRVDELQQPFIWISSAQR
ncbi:MAG: hypothetical protein CMJ81_17255 [Planctomycetaceae bacterium]|nr:hypothetical protein [Planctomycetaceae bacterium]MBP62177.1 hypothetical protein [Planctomycetaceae bacterium]